MNKPRDPRELAVDLLPRSTRSVQVAAVIADNYGIFSWGVNHEGFDGLGCHAEREAIRRANRRRLQDATVYVASRRRRNGRAVTSKPCEDCARVIEKHGLSVVWRDSEGVWHHG